MIRQTIAASTPPDSTHAASPVSTPTWLFVLGIATVGALVLWHAAAIVLSSPPNVSVLVLGALTLAAGRWHIKIPGRSATVSFSDLFVFTSVVLVGPAPATIIVAIDGLWTSLMQQDRRVHRTLFNVAEPALSTWAAGHAFFFVVSYLSAPGGAPDLRARVAGTVAMAATYFLLNSTLTARAVAMESRQSAYVIWRHHALYLAVNDYAAASLATLLVHDGTGIDLQAVSLVAPLLLLSYVAYKTAATRIEEAQQHVDAVEHLYAATIETLAIAVDAKDQVTHGHIRRVQRHTVQLAQHLGISDGTALRALQAASLLHDVGKLAVPDYVLNKPGRLTGSEFDTMKQHASTGASILARVEFPYPVVPIVRHHHEQWNGRGYPDGLIGEAIPIGARILSVVDCFDALTSDRPYRRKMTDLQATAILVAERGVMYDARVVDAFIDLLPNLRRGDADVSSPLREHEPDAAPFPSLEATAGAADADLVATRALQEAGRAAALVIAQLIPRTECCVFVPASSCESLVSAYASPIVEAVITAIPLRIGEGLSGWVAATRHTIVNSPADLELGEAARRLDLTRCTSTPVFALGDLAAVFTVYAPRNLSAEEAGTIGRLGQEIGLSLARARETSTQTPGLSAAVSAA